MANDASFGFTKNTEGISRRPSFANSFQTILDKKSKQGPDVAALLKERSAGYLLKKSSAGRFNKRFVAVHGHYLSYYKADPGEYGADKTPQGILDLWHVEGVSIDDATISLRLSPHAFQARQDEMGSDVAKKLLLGNNAMTRTMMRRFDHARRAGADSNFVLKAADAKAAQAWLVIMRESPLMGSLANLQRALEDEGELTVRAFRVSMPPKREFIFTDAASILSGSTEILLRRMPLRGTVMSVALGAGPTNGLNDFQASTSFEPKMKDGGGELILETPVGRNVRVFWRRKFPSYRSTMTTTMLTFGGIAFLGLVVTGSFFASIVLAILCATGAGVMSFVQEQQENNIYIKSIVILSADGTASTSSPPSSPKSGLRRKALSSSKIPVSIAKYVSTDPHITPEEAPMVAELRQRVQNMWQVQPDADNFIRKHERFLKDWHADLTAIKDLDRIKIVMDKHISEDHRIVRFIRARKHKIDKAESMLRESLLWRVALSSDSVLHDPDLGLPPDWVAQYFGPKNIMRMLRPYEESDIRLQELYTRDKEGHLGIFFRAGRINTRKIFRKMCSKPSFMMKLVIWTTEMLRYDLERHRELTAGKPETLLSIIVDLDGFAISEHIPLPDLIPLARRFFPIFATSYPELLNRVLIFNAPWLFSGIWNAVKPFIPEEVLEKIQIHSGEINYEKHIRPYFEDKYVPKYFGGTMVDSTDGNEFCLDRVAPFGPYGLPGEGQELLEGFDLKAQTW